MSIDMWPYSDRNGGRVDDIEHEALWGGTADGVLPGQSSNAVQASVDGGQWVVAPGTILIRGKAVRVLESVTGAIPAPAGATRTCVVTAYVDRSSDPWEAGARLVRGTPGGGRPSVSTSETGLYEVPLRAFRIASSGAVEVGPDERPQLIRNGIMPLRRMFLATGGNVVNGSPSYAGSWNEDYGPGASWQWGGHSSVSVIPNSGYWRMNAAVRFDATSGGSRQVELVRGAGASASDVTAVMRRVYETAEGTPGRNITVSVDTILRLDAGESVSIRVIQTSGATMQVVTGSPFTWYELAWLRPF